MTDETQSRQGGDSVRGGGAITDTSSRARSSWERTIEAAVRRVLGAGLHMIVRLGVAFAKTDVTIRTAFLATSNETTSPAGLSVALTGGAAQANRTATLQTTEIGVSNDGTLALQPNGGGVSYGGAAFPANPQAGWSHFRTDKKCWYYYDGAKWNVSGVEQSVITNAAASQTINSTTHTDLTNSSVSVTTAGAGVIVLAGWVRVSGNTGTFICDALINGTGVPAQQAVTAVTADHTIPVGNRVAVTAAGTYTCKLQGWMVAGATSVTVQSSLHVVEVVGA